MTTTPSFSEEKKDEGDISVKTVPGDGDGGANTNMTYIPYLSVPAQRHVQPVKNHADSPLQPSKGSRTPSPTPFWIRLLGGTLRSLVIDIPLTLLFTAIVAAAIVDKVHDKYLAKQIDLMKFQENSRDFLELTYYHRYCEMDDEISATSNDQLLVPENATAEECVAHQMTHGVSVYRNLLTPETMHELREFIVEENKKQDGFYVIENDFRYSWGIDVNMHPAIKKYWKELGSNELLVKGIQAIVGPDPAIIEFTAITSAYGAADQFDHQDVIPPGNGIKYAHCKSINNCCDSAEYMVLWFSDIPFPFVLPCSVHAVVFPFHPTSGYVLRYGGDACLPGLALVRGWCGSELHEAQSCHVG